MIESKPMENASQISVVKRNGTRELLNLEKIHKVLFWATAGLKGVSVSDIEMNAHLYFYDGIKSKDIHMVLVNSASYMISSKTPNYQYVAGKLLSHYLRKEVFGNIKSFPHLSKIIKKNVDVGVYDPKILEWYSEEEIDTINDFLKHDRDFEFSHAGLKQLMDKYLIQNREDKTIYETPQIMFALIAMTLFRSYSSDKRLQYVRKFYNAISTFKINLPTPIMCGVRSPNRQYSSCTLIDVGDNIDSLAHSNSAVMKYTAKRAGIGINFGRIRAVGSKIRNGEVISTGVVPYLKVFEATVKSCTQNGVRGGSATVHFPFWHWEIEDILVLKNNKGSEDNRVRKLDYSIQFCRLFYKRVQEDGDITLFSPHEVPELYEAMFSGNNDLFEKIYAEAEKNTSIRKSTIKARELLEKYCKERFETGRMYLMNTDHCNVHSSFKDPIYQSNLCQEITLPTKPILHIDDDVDDDGEIALCVLSAVNMGQTKIKELPEICDLIVRSLDYVIEHQDYPVSAALKMKKRRSIGIGLINLAYFFAKNKVEYGSTESLALVDEYMEAMQYNCIKASVELAKEFGACDYFNRTKYADGILPIDTYCKNVDSICSRPLSQDWESLRAEVKKFGMRNSTLTAVMPAESSAVVSNATNGIEPPRSLVSGKKSKKGIVRQVVPDSNRIGVNYTIAWELYGNDKYNRICAIIQKYIDQAISANHYYNPAFFEDKSIPLSMIMEDIIQHYWLGGKTLYYANTYDGKTDDDSSDSSGCAGGACSV